MTTMTKENEVATSGQAAGVTWADVIGANWQPVGDGEYTSDAYAGCVLTICHTDHFAAADHSLAATDVRAASLDFPDGSWVVFAGAPEWELPAVNVYAYGV